MTREQAARIIEESFREAIKEYSDILAGSVYNTIYRTHQSGWYDRTGDFFLSVSNPYFEIGNDTIAFDVYNTDYIHARNGTLGKLGHHRSFPWSRPHPSDKVVRENLFDWLNNGFTILGKKRHPGFHFFNNNMDLTQRLTKMIAQKMYQKIKEVTR